jgi:hypothetical protein
MVNVAVLMQFLAPALPFLVKAGDKAMDGAITKMGEDAWDTAKAIWERLMPKVEADPVMKKAVEKAVADPDNTDRQTAFRLALQDFLADNPDVADDLKQLLEEELPATGMEHKAVTQTIGKMDRGSKAVASIENVRGNVSL